MDKKINDLIKSWQKRNISGFFFKDARETVEKIKSIIPKDASVGISGSVTLNELGIVAELEQRGNRVFNQYRSGITRGESLEFRNQGAQADYYLASANAVSETGELIFLSAYGNRIAGVSNAKNVIIVCGINKLEPTLEKALKRAREYAAPLNCKRLNWNSACLQEGICRQDICFSPEYKRMCCNTLIVEAEVIPDRLKVILVKQKLGF
ncbi:MAG: lactate utilization protein [Candidatus Omnitrophota bacterium]